MNAGQFLGFISVLNAAVVAIALVQNKTSTSDFVCLFLAVVFAMAYGCYLGQKIEKETKETEET